MGRLRIQISSDGLAAEVLVTPGPMLAPSDLEKALKEAGVTHGLMADAVTETGLRLADEKWQFRGELARGDAMVPGLDGHVEATFKQGPFPGRQSVDGVMDYHERDLLHATATDEVIARHIPPRPGRAGRDVRGRDLAPTLPKDVMPRLGPGVRLEDDRIAATRDGVVQFVAGKSIDVLPLWKHDGNVDLHSGNLNARGSVLIAGDICAGFKVIGTGDIVVKGAVLGSLTTTGNVLAENSIQGMDADVHAGGELICRHATSCKLHADGIVRIADQAVHANIRGQEIELLRGRGRVVGGELRARTAVRLLEAGTEAGAETLLSAGDLLDQQADLVRLECEQQRLQRAGHKRALGDERGKGGKAGRQAMGVGDRAQTERLELAHRQRELMRTATVIVSGQIHPGVRVRLGEACFDVNETIVGARFRWNEESRQIVREQP